MHSWAYRSADHVAGPEIGAGVLVVGGGNSGFQIAADLAAAGRRVSVSIGRRNACVPQRLLGRDIFWWQATTGLLRVSADSWLGRRMREADGTVIGLSARELLRRRGIVLRARVSAAVGRVVRFADGGTLEPDAVVWATGFSAGLSVVARARRPRRGRSCPPSSRYHARAGPLCPWVAVAAYHRFSAFGVRRRRRGLSGRPHSGISETEPFLMINVDRRAACEANGRPLRISGFLLQHSKTCGNFEGRCSR